MHICAEKRTPGEVTGAREGAGQEGDWRSGAGKELCSGAVDPRPNGFSQEVTGYLSQEVLRSSPDGHLLGDL